MFVCWIEMKKYKISDFYHSLYIRSLSALQSCLSRLSFSLPTDWTIKYKQLISDGGVNSQK